MKFSISLPTGFEGVMYPIPFVDPSDFVRMAKLCERLGYHSVWGNDHMTTQNYVRAEFPVPPRFWEPLVTYAFVLSETKKIKVGTGILVLPMRHDIVVAAKQICTLDHFGKGRLELGIGIGLRVPHYEHIFANKPTVDWFEIISENYMVDGGRPLRMLDRIMEQYHPLGPVAVITAFNFPVAVWAWNAFIAAIAGDTVIWKPSPKATRSNASVVPRIPPRSPIFCYRTTLGGSPGR